MVARIRELLSKQVWYQYQPKGRARSQGLAEIAKELRKFPKDLVRKETAAKKQRRVYSGGLDSLRCHARPSTPPLATLLGLRHRAAGEDGAYPVDHDS